MVSYLSNSIKHYIALQTHNTIAGFEICEELWCSDSPHIPLSMDGVEIICNGSGSHTQLRKNHVLADLVKSATMKCGGNLSFKSVLRQYGIHIFQVVMYLVI